MPVSLVDCQLTWQERAPIDVASARAEHRAYRQALADAGLEVIVIAADEDTPDCPFVEDLLLDLGDGPRILCRPGAAARQPEQLAVAQAVRALDDGVELVPMPSDLTLDGGDVLLFRDRLYVGRSTRSTEDAMHWLARTTGRSVVGVELHDVLHLKTGVTALDDDTLLAAPGAVDLTPFGPDVTVLEHPACNAVRLPDRLLADPEAALGLRERGFEVTSLAIPELARAEAGLTCLSVLLHNRT
ncbi:MAG: dimethylargininase [Proteobacteria bacterium]|nr:dimethylargininase [Pseudomonadota bacterium]